MRTLKELIDYTMEKKEFQVRDEEYFYFNPVEEIRLFTIDEESDTTVGSSFDFISSWYHYNYILNFLKTRELNDKNLCVSTLYALESNNWEFFLCKKFPNYDESILFHIAIKHLAQSMILGWDSLAIKYGNMLIKMLYGKQYDGWHSAYKHPWFMLEMFCKWQNIKLDYTKLNYPHDVDIYQQVIQYWNTSDRRLLNLLINKMVSFHISQSDEYEYEENTPDFPSSDYFVYAIEILMWLNIRERMGFLDYIPDNELMNLPINNWHTKKIGIPDIELIKKAKIKLLHDYPDLEFEF